MLPALYYEKIFAANRNMHKSGGENKAVADFLRKNIKQQEEYNQLLKELLNRDIK
ncbi:YrzO family protein [Bacillus halotolerans]|uniref:YrzO family protein n=1 Tax=Bacillus halotolerans TaxID=260554 RepID=UPI00241081CB|nr:YrzO family protein [Bacillus halotolerans]MDG3073120.1 YrzO family protein [Bacillus halotolerans]